MKTRPLFTDNLIYTWQICLLEDDEGNCELLNFLKGLGESDKSNWRFMLAKLKTIAQSEDGAKLYGKNFCHEMGSSKYKLFRFSQGSLRISWFYGDGDKIILCAHGYVKKSNKTDTRDIRKAEKIYEEYKRDEHTRRT